MQLINKKSCEKVTGGGPWKEEREEAKVASIHVPFPLKDYETKPKP